MASETITLERPQKRLGLKGLVIFIVCHWHDDRGHGSPCGVLRHDVCVLSGDPYSAPVLHQSDFRAAEK